MLTDTNLRSAVDALWDKLWSGGLSNPLDAKMIGPRPGECVCDPATGTSRPPVD